MSIIVFQHSDENRSGRLGAALRDNAHRLDFRQLHKGDPVPPDFDNVTGVVSLGGPQNVGEDHPWMPDEIEFLREAHERRLPVVGVCLGSQLIAAALGGTVEPMGEPEVGFLDVEVLSPGHTDTALAGIAWKSRQFLHHAQAITKAPDGATVLARSERCAVQAFRAGLRTYGFQYHFEADTQIMADIHRASGEMGVPMAELQQQADQHYQTFARLANRLCVNLAAFVMPAGKLVGASGGA